MELYNRLVVWHNTNWPTRNKYLYKTRVKNTVLHIVNASHLLQGSINIIM